MPNTAQTMSTEPQAGVLKHQKEKLMDISWPQEDINDVDNVTVSSPEKDILLVDVNVALIINIAWNSSQSWALGSINKEVRKWRFKKAEQKLNIVLRRPTKLKWSHLPQH